MRVANFLDIFVQLKELQSCQVKIAVHSAAAAAAAAAVWHVLISDRQIMYGIVGQVREAVTEATAGVTVARMR